MLLPRRAFLHPSWLVALFALGVNDHVLKHVVPGFVTGKLSDFAGLFVAPAVLAALIRARSRRSVFAAHAAVAIVFALVKTVPFATHVFESALSLVIASRVWTDPTDLVAIPMVALSYRVLVPIMEAPARDGILSRLATVAGAVMCVATSAPNVPPVAVKNDSKHELDVTIRATDAQYDESFVLSTTPLPFHPIAFDGKTTSYHVKASSSVDGTAPLDKLVLVTLDDPSASLHDQFVVAGSDSYSYRTLQIIDLPNGHVSIAPTTGLFIRAVGDTEPCAAKPGPVYSLSLPQAASTIASLTTDANGCLDIAFEEPVPHGRACLPDGAWPFQKGDAIKGENGTAVRDDGMTRVTLSVSNVVTKPSTDSICVMRDACGAMAIDRVIELPDGASIHSGEEHVAMANRTTSHWYAGRVLRVILARSSCRDQFDQVSDDASLVEVQTGPSFPTDGGSDASTD